MGRATAGGDPPTRRVVGEGGWLDHRVHPAQGLPQGGSSPRVVGEAGESSGACSYLLCHGVLLVLQALVRQSHRQNDLARDGGEMPSLLLLLHRPGTGSVLFAGSHVGSLSPAVLLQRA